MLESAKFDGLFQVGLTSLLNKFLKKTFLLSRSEFSLILQDSDPVTPKSKSLPLGSPSPREQLCNRYCSHGNKQQPGAAAAAGQGVCPILRKEVGREEFDEWMRKLPKGKS
jgi:hypothetical protein